VFRGKALRLIFRQGFLADRFDQPSPSGFAECAIKALWDMAVLTKVSDDGPCCPVSAEDEEKIGNQVRPIERPGFPPVSGNFPSTARIRA